MRKTLLLFFIIHFQFSIINSFAQPAIEWKKTFGGKNFDAAYSIQQTTDGGYIIGGVSSSNDDYVAGNHGRNDYWIFKIDSTGNREWQKSLGGSGNEDLWSIQQTSDGGYIVAGNSDSNDGDVTGHHGVSDFWVVKLSSTGNIVWQKSLGGTDDDYARSIQQTTDGGYIIAGTTKSNDGDVSDNNGWYDCWIVKLNSAGNMAWQKCLGGTGYDAAFSIQQATDGGYIIAGETDSNQGDVTGNHGGEDCWIVKLDNAGIIAWQKCLGGTNFDAARSIQQTSDSGYIVAAQSLSYDGDVTGLHGGYDYWIVKLSNDRSIEWQKTLGGGAEDRLLSIQQTFDGGYIVAGHSSSNDGNVTGNHGGYYDYWLVKLNNIGIIEWQKSLGGTGNDLAFSIQQTRDGGYIVGGYTSSNNGDITGNHGSSDIWIVKLGPAAFIEGKAFIDENYNQLQDAGESGHPNLVIQVQPGDYFSPVTDTSGSYSLMVAAGRSYTVTVNKIPYYNVVPSSHSTPLLSIGDKDTLNDFALQPFVVIHDLSVLVTGLTRARRGNQLFYTLTIKNNGTVHENASLKFVPDVMLAYISASPSADAIIGDTLQWDNIYLIPGQKKDFHVTLNAGWSIAIGTDLISYAVAETAGENTPADNSDTLHQVAFGSHDPNEIEVHPGGDVRVSRIRQGQWMDYTIRFQNTGNDTAFRVEISDSLVSSKLYLNTMDVVASSHPVTWKIVNSIAYFDFDPICLPDSNNSEPSSHGFVRFRMKADTTLSEGDLISNMAKIYFDQNPFVATNTVATNITDIATGIPTPSVDALSLFPNPCQGTLHVRGNGRFAIYSVFGEELRKGLINRSKVLDVSNLCSGLYILMIETGERRTVTRFVKE